MPFVTGRGRGPALRLGFSPDPPDEVPMKHPIACALALAIATALSGCATAPAATADKEAQMPNPAYSGVFASPSTLDLNYPRFDQIQDSDFAPALDAGMAEQLRQIDAIANNPAPATFQNTIVAR